MRSEPLGETPRERRQPGIRLARRLAWVMVPVAVLGEAGHQLLGRFGRPFAHHLFHILFAGGAIVLFAAVVAIDIRRHGWPTFSWRIRPPVPPRPDPRP